MTKKGIPALFITGLMIVVLLILSGIVALIVNIPVAIVGLSLNLPVWVPLVLSVVIGVIVLGWTFTTFMVRKRGR